MLLWILCRTVTASTQPMQSARARTPPQKQGLSTSHAWSPSFQASRLGKVDHLSVQMALLCEPLGWATDRQRQPAPRLIEAASVRAAGQTSASTTLCAPKKFVGSGERGLATGCLVCRGILACRRLRSGRTNAAACQTPSASSGSGAGASNCCARTGTQKSVVRVLL